MSSTGAHVCSCTRPGDHLVVAERDGEVVGYAFSGDYRPRSGYRYTRETSVYLAPEARGQGIGRALYDEMHRAGCAPTGSARWSR